MVPMVHVTLPFHSLRVAIHSSNNSFLRLGYFQAAPTTYGGK